MRPWRVTTRGLLSVNLKAGIVSAILPSEKETSRPRNACSPQFEGRFHAKANTRSTRRRRHGMWRRGVKRFYSDTSLLVKPFRRLRIDSPESVNRCAFVDERVANGVGKPRIADRCMPALGRNLTRDDCRAQSVAIVEDFE